MNSVFTQNLLHIFDIEDRAQSCSKFGTAIDKEFNIGIAFVLTVSLYLVEFIIAVISCNGLTPLKLKIPQNIILSGCLKFC